MNIVIKGTNTELSPSMKEYVNEKIGSLSKYVKRVVEVDVELEVDKKHKSGEIYRSEVTMYVPRDVLRATEKATDMYAAIDLVIPKLKKQIEKYKAKLKHKNGVKKKGFLGFRNIFRSRAEEKYAKEIAEEEAKPEIVKRKRFSFTDLISEEEAIKTMNLIGHDFYLFNNIETRRMSVVYRRGEGNYGIIEPE